MVDISKLVMLACVTIISLFYLCKTILNRRRVRLYGYLSAVLGAYALWAIVMIIFTISEAGGLNLIIYNLDVPICSLFIVCVHVLTLRFYRENLYVSPAYVASLAVFPFFSFILAFSSYFNEFIRSGVRETIISGERQVLATLQIWFWIMAGYNALLILISVAYVLSKHFRLINIHRPPSLILLCSLLVLLLGNVTLATSRTRPLDVYQLVVASCAMFLVYSAVIRSLDLEFLAKARNDIYAGFPDAVFILDGGQRIIEKNEAAVRWFDRLHIKQSSPSYQGLIEGLVETATQIENLTDVESGRDFYFDVHNRAETYNLREKPITDNKDRQIGTFVVLEDVTENRALIQRLEVGAGRDSLTGLNNRGMMEIFKTELCQPEYLPLAVLMCDLNNLKKVNDTIGHQQGDLMLRVAGESLNTQLPPNALAGRVGGDEFLVLIPRTDFAQATEILHSIREHLKRENELPFEVTMAMGAAVMDSMDESFDNILKQADEAMYANKRTYKTRFTEGL